MKKFYTYSIFAILGMVMSLNVNAQITVDNTLTIEELVNDVLLGEGVSAFNVTYNGLPGTEIEQQAGTFDAIGTNFLIGEGLLMSTSYLEMINEGGGNNNAGTGFPDSTDADLGIIAGQEMHNACVIEFDFTVNSDSVKFEYIFASAEYPGFTCSTFNDAFGFFLSGPGIDGGGIFDNNAVNIALIPNSDVPVAINTLNSGTPANNPTCLEANPNYMEDSQYFEPNDPVDPNNLQIQGFTHVLTAEYEIECGETYHIKLAVANAFDEQLQTAVFLKKGSFSAAGEVFVDVSPSIGGVTISDPQYEDVIVAGCSEFGIELTRPEGANVDSVFVVFGGTAVENQDYILGENDTLKFFPDGIDTLRYQVQTIWDGVPDENEVLEIMVIYPVGCLGDYDTAYASLPFVDPYILESSTMGITLTCPNDIAEVSAEGSNGIGPYIYNWGDYGTDAEAIITNPPPPGEQAYYPVLIGDQCTENSTGGFEAIWDSALVVNNIPPPLQAAIAGFDQPTCPNEPVFLESIVIDGTPPYTYVWRNINGSPISSEENATAQYIFDTDVTLTVVDDCQTEVGDTTSIFYPQYDSLIVSFPPLEDNCPSDPVSLTAEYTGGAGDVQFAWSQLEGESEFVMPVDSQNTAVIPGSGMNVYSVSVTDRCFRQGYLGLTPGTDTFIDSLRTINLDNLPNVITPNDDNRNDFFVVGGVEEFDNARLEVFDRWGRMVFETDNYKAGTSAGDFENAFDGKDLEDGTYFYVINVELGECVQSGTIQVLRSDN